MGGCAAGGAVIADTQTYNPTTNAWSTGVPLPAPACAAVAAVANGVLFVIGGSLDDAGFTVLNSVWAYSPKTKRWSARAPMPTARDGAVAVVVNNTIYIIGGNGGSTGAGPTPLATVESYIPATDTWQEESPLLTAKVSTSAGRLGSTTSGFTIIDADGYLTSADTGDNEAFNVATNSWSALTPDSTLREAACFGTIGSRLYVAGGWNGSSVINSAESFNSSTEHLENAGSHAVGDRLGRFGRVQGKIVLFRRVAEFLQRRYRQ